MSGKNIGKQEEKRARMNVKELRILSALSQKEFSEKYTIPKRTIEDWESGRRNPPGYVIALLERAVKEDFMQNGE